MAIEVKVPLLPESISDATVSVWHKKVGDKVARDENIVDLETDKVMLEVPAPAEGILKEIIYQAGATVKAEQVIARIEASSAKASTVAKESPKEAVAEVAPAVQKTAASAQKVSTTAQQTVSQAVLSPSARRAAAEQGIEAQAMSARITKTDVTTIPSGARPEKRVPMTRIRSRIAERLLEVKQNTPCSLRLMK